MSELSKHLSDTNTSQRAFAELIGCSPSYLSEIMSGRKRPGMDLAFKIHRATGGKVTVESWMKDVA